MKTLANNPNRSVHANHLEEAPAAEARPKTPGRAGRFLQRLTLGAIVATAALTGSASGQVRLNASITNVSYPLGLIDDNTLLYQGSGLGTWMCDEPLAPGWGTKLVNSYGPGLCVYDAPRKRFVGSTGGKLIQTLTLNPTNGTWTFAKYSVNDYVYTGGTAAGLVSVDPATGDIFFRSALSNYVYVCNLEKGQWGTVISTVPGFNPVYDRNDPERSVYFRGSNNLLYRTYYIAGQWKTVQIGNALLNSDPVINAKKSVVFRDSANRIGSTWLDGNFWNTAAWTPVNNVNSEPVVGSWSGLVYYRGTDNNLYRCSWTGYGFTTQKLTSTANISHGYGEHKVLFVNSKDQVFYRGTDNSLWRW